MIDTSSSTNLYAYSFKRVNMKREYLIPPVEKLDK